MTVSPSPAEPTSVLLVEDEAMVRRVIRLALQDQGFNITEAKDGEEAIQLADEWQGPLHLLITDLLLPKISGCDVAQHVLAKHQETRVLFLSGYTEDIIIGRDILGPKSAFLQKPFQPPYLLNKVRALLSVN